MSLAHLDQLDWLGLCTRNPAPDASPPSAPSPFAVFDVVASVPLALPSAEAHNRAWLWRSERNQRLEDVARKLVELASTWDEGSPLCLLTQLAEEARQVLEIPPEGKPE